MTERKRQISRGRDGSSVNLSRGLQPARTIARAEARGSLMLLLIATAAITGCVRRTMTITTQPSNALVLLNDQEIGRTEVATDFLWYGDYDIVIRKEGFKTLQTNWKVKPPWYQIPPLDFFFEILWPGRLHDVHARDFVLEPETPAVTEEVIDRAIETRDATLHPG